MLLTRTKIFPMHNGHNQKGIVKRDCIGLAYVILLPSNKDRSPAYK
jgi:hypothetical protein